MNITNCNSTITRSYFNDNLLNTESNKYGDNITRTVTYTYDADGRRASLDYPGSAYTFTYSYTQRGQLNQINPGTTALADYSYDLNGNLTSRTLDNSTSSTYGYDAVNRCTSISHTFAPTSTAPITRTFGYGYDSVGNRNWVKRDGANGDIYDYDLNDQAITTKLDIANPDTTAPGPQTIVYDANGNRTSFAPPYVAPETYDPVNALNQYTKRNGSSAGYDANGNMTTGFDGSTYTYDAQNRLLSAKEASGPLVTFLYDGLNRQIGKKIGSQPLYYRVYDGWDLLGEYKTGTTNAIFAYLYGAGGLVKNVVTNNYYYQDASGSTSHVAGSNGALKEYYLYDLQGKPTFFNAAGTQLSDTAIGVRHLFTGQQWYNEIGLYDLRNRYYSPDIGRFLQADPSGFEGDTTNLYRYCNNNPLKWSDPSGLGFWSRIATFLFSGNNYRSSNPGGFNPSYTPTGSNIPLTYDNAVDQGYAANTQGFASYIADHVPSGFSSSQAYLGVATSAFVDTARSIGASYLSLTTTIRTGAVINGFQAGVKSVQSALLTSDRQLIQFEPYFGTTNVLGSEWRGFATQMNSRLLSDGNVDRISFEATVYAAPIYYSGSHYSIDYSITLTIDHASNEYYVGGWHDGFPSYNLSANGTTLYDFPEPSPMSFFNLAPPMSVHAHAYGDWW